MILFMFVDFQQLQKSFMMFFLFVSFLQLIRSFCQHFVAQAPYAYYRISLHIRIKCETYIL